MSTITFSTVFNGLKGSEILFRDILMRRFISGGKAVGMEYKKGSSLPLTLVHFLDKLVFNQ